MAHTEADLTEDEREQAEEWLVESLLHEMDKIAKDLGIDPEPPSGEWTDEECARISAEHRRRSLPIFISQVLQHRT
jgi:hypothetical protein